MILLVPSSVFAGDCLSHPVFIHDMEIHSCAVMSEANAGEVSNKIAPPKVIAQVYPGIILKGQIKAVRQIDIDAPDHANPFVHPWQSKEEQQTFLYSGKLVTDGCDAFKPKTRIKFVSYTNCECDTGPRPNGYCALQIDKISDIPDVYLQYAQ